VIVEVVDAFGNVLAGAGYTLHVTVGGGLPDIDSNPFNVL
jgi:hypothetical protein